MPLAPQDFSAPLAPAALPQWARPIFDYDEAFRRNIGWLTEWEQQLLRAKRIAIAGMGGVGGIHLQTLARLGVGAFSIADMDRFELANFNRQAAAFMDTLGAPKVEAAARMARGVNPELDLRLFPEGVTEGNLDAFLDGVDLYVDSLDYFAFAIRRAVFARCRGLGIPAVTAAPIGMGTGYLVFTPDGMSFEDYFRLNDAAPRNWPTDFLLGLTPAMLHRRYLADPSRVDLAAQSGPSTAIACQLCAAVAAAEGIKLLLGRGKVRPAPHYRQFDAYRGRFVSRRLPFGNGGPGQRVKRFLAARLATRLSRAARPPEAPLPREATAMDHILEAARWTPSGDNSQPWRFEIINEMQLCIHADLEAGNVYQYRASEPNWLALGMLLQSITLAARAHGRETRWALAEETPATARIEVTFTPATVVKSPLLDFIKVRSVDRRPYRRQRLTQAQKAALERAAGEGLSIDWREGFSERMAIAGLTARASAIRLRIPECHHVHRQALDWTGPYSRTGLPGAASGINWLLRPLMRWALHSHGRMMLLTQWLKGRWLAFIDMDWRPAWGCAGFAVIRQAIAPPEALRAVDRLVIGQRLMTVWLEATRLGLAFQPNIAAICFAHHGRDGGAFTKDPAARRWAGRLAARFAALFPDSPSCVVFLARLGVPRSRGTASRSLRRPLKALVVGDRRRGGRTQATEGSEA